MPEQICDLLLKDQASIILLQTNHDGSQIFANFLKDNPIPYIENARTLADQELLSAIQDCIKFVKDYNNLPMLLNIVKQKLTFIYHEMNYAPAAYTVFETLNDRGLDVSWLDKLKTRLMYVAFVDNQENDIPLRTLHDIWSKIYAAIGIYQDLDKEALAFGATLMSEKLVRRSFSEKGAVEYFMRICDDTPHIAIEISNWILKIIEEFNDFTHKMSTKKAVTKVSHARLLGLAINMRQCSDQERDELFKAWEKTTFHIFGLCFTDARREKSKYVRLAWETLNGRSAKYILSVLNDLDANYSIDKTRIENQNSYKEWKEEVRYILHRYEEYLANQQGTSIRDTEWDHIWNNTPNRSIEHILPQSKGSRVPIDPDQDDVFVHRLGNLLLLRVGLNSQLGNMDPEKKVDQYKNSNFLIASEVAQTIEQEGGWGLKQIEQREQKLIKWICDQWED